MKGKKTKRRLLSMALMLVLVLPLTACSKNGKTGEEQNTESEVNSVVNTTVDSTEDSKESIAYTPEKELKLTVWETQGTDYAPPEQIKNDIVADWLEKKTLVSVTDMYGNDGGAWDIKLAKLVAGNNLPNIVHCSAHQGPAHFAKLDEINQVWGLTPEMIQTYAPELWKRTPAKYWEEFTVNGHILGIPYKSAANEDIFPDLDPEDINYIENMTRVYDTDVTHSVNCFWIRDDILKMIYPDTKSYDELVAMLDGIEKPIGDQLLDIPITNTQEYIDFMYKIKELNLKTDNGKTIYAFGYDGGDNWSALSYLGSDMYGYKHHNYTGTWNEKKQVYEVPLVGDMIKEAARVQNQMINDGVIEAASLAHTSEQFKEKILTGQYAIVPINYAGYPDQINAELEARGASYRYRPFITLVPNQEEYPAFTTKSTWVDSICLLKTLTEDEVIQVLNWINVQYTAEYDKVKNWGPEEAGLYEETEDGKLKFKDERFNEYYIEGNLEALPDAEERMGLGGTGGLMNVVACNTDYYTPRVMWRKNEFYLPRLNKGFAFPSDSEHVKDVKTFAAVQIWDSAYASIPEVVTYWSTRNQWEDKFKMAFAAPVAEFDAKWQEALDELYSIVDIDEMCEKCTVIAREQNAQ